MAYNRQKFEPWVEAFKKLAGETLLRTKSSHGPRKASEVDIFFYPIDRANEREPRKTPKFRILAQSDSPVRDGVGCIERVHA
jgi:hypothetical protein